MTSTELPAVFRAFPAVYAVGADYHIFIVPAARAVMWCRIGGKVYRDEANGVMRSECPVHRIVVPAAELDRAGSYTVGYRTFKERVPYYNKVVEEGEFTFGFRPVTADDPKFCLISDVHSHIEAGIAAARAFEGPDFLIVNGDIHNDSATLEQMHSDHILAGNITRGEIPAVFSRGNHDLRGAWAEKQPELAPLPGGCSYGTFRLGPVWGVILDAAEDKPDEFCEYGGVNCCHEFRLRETAFLRELVTRKSSEYEAPGVKYRVAVAHINFSEPHKPPFDIEYGIYAQWCELLREKIRPCCCLYGHVHRNYITMPGAERDIFDLGAPAIVAGVPVPGEKGTGFSGAGITLTPEAIGVRYIDQTGRTLEEHRIGRGAKE